MKKQSYSGSQYINQRVDIAGILFGRLAFPHHLPHCEIALPVQARVVENIGLAWQSQLVKLREQADRFNCHDMVTVGADGRF